jgi:hypothetical protein
MWEWPEQGCHAGWLAKKKVENGIVKAQRLVVLRSDLIGIMDQFMGVTSYVPGFGATD